MTKVYVEARPCEWEFVCETDDTSAFTESKGRFRFEAVAAPVEAPVVETPKADDTEAN